MVEDVLRINRIIGRMLRDTLLGVTLLGVVLIPVLFLASLYFKIDFQPYLIKSAQFLSGGKVVSFEEAFENSADKNIRVCKIERKNTDDDDFKEWVVYYQFDTVASKNWKQPCPDNSPRSVAIYDTDRGNPAIIFPYNLKAPDRDFLGEQGVVLRQEELVKNIVAGPPASGTADEVKELLFFGIGAGTNNQLTIFKYQYNTENWESPTNVPDRYILIGAFSGSGGVSFDKDTREVTVKDRGPFERSQLVVKTVYKLHGAEGYETYMKKFGATELQRPVRSTIDFATKPPADILNTEYPEKIVLAFYQSLDASYGRNWNTSDFLAAGGQAAVEYNNGNLPYFGFASRGAVSGLAVVALQYFPLAEQVSASASIEGPRPQYGYVEAAIAAQQDGAPVRSELIKFLMVYQNGKWKIESRMSYQGSPAKTGEPPASGSTSTTPAPGATANPQPTSTIHIFLRSKNGLTFGFDGSQSTAQNGRIVAYEWNFGDGNTGSGDKIVYTYAQAGAHTVTLTVFDDKGQTGTAAMNIP